MEIYLATDHAGFELKEQMKGYLIKQGYSVEDCGAYRLDPNDDYPDYIKTAARAISQNPENRVGVIFGGSGQGEAMVANKFPGVRAAVYYGFQPEIIELSRKHNGANILSLGARFVTIEQAQEAVDLWLNTPVTEEERHAVKISLKSSGPAE
jgi:ribose 5-phosphate isomerase B